MADHKFSRRDFFKAGSISGATLMMGTGFSQTKKGEIDYSSATLANPKPDLPSRYALDLSPAKWIWYPSQRTLANTFVLFRKSIRLSKEIQSAKGWILGDSRYQLEVNNKRIQWGPAPADPRYTEADPVDLTNYLSKGENAIGATVLYYGFGDGTWPLGKPGFLFKLIIRFADDSEQTIVSDQTWKCHLARSWTPGQYKRWYLRSLQEEFDARKYPYNWTSSDFEPAENWLDANELEGEATKTALSNSNSDYMYESSGNLATTELRKRSIPLINETDHHELSLQEACLVKWNRPPQEFFEMVVPNAYTYHNNLFVKTDENSWVFSAEPELGAVLTFSIIEQMVGWPFFTIEAPEGTVIELMVQEGHRLHKEGGPALINNHFNSWTRFICAKGENHFHTFDFESIKWVQLHIHETSGTIRIKNLGIKRRMYDWPNQPRIKTSDNNLQKLINASINTTYNNSLDTIVDGMGRERQQYSGDLGHMVHVLYRVFGEDRLPARFINTYSQGLTKDGFFLDTWPAYDRLNRLMQRQLDLTKWGPLLDHGVGFNFDCYHHYLYSGKLEDLDEVWPRLERFFRYLQSIVRGDGLLPVENIGIPAVWIDHDAYHQQRHKQCAFNLYTIAMIHNAFSMLAKAFDRNELAREAKTFADQLLQNTIKTFWDPSQKIFICNKPWIKEDNGQILCDRSLSTAILFDLCPENAFTEAARILAEKPKNLGLSYPPNTIWYLWALAKSNRTDAMFNDFNSRWINLNSVHENNTMQESWHSTPDSGSQWSHASIAPLISVYMDIAGIQPTKPAYKKFIIEPKPGTLEQLELQNYTPSGPIVFSLQGKKGNRKLRLTIPNKISGMLIVDEREKLKLKVIGQGEGKKNYELAPGASYNLKLKYL